MPNKILFNGKEYNHLDEMPPDARRAYEMAMGQVNSLLEDKDQDGVPDIFETLPTDKPQNLQVFTTSKVIVDGKVYDRLSDAPPEVQQKYEQVFADKDQDGIPDMLDSMGQIQTPAVSKMPKTSFPPMAMSPSQVHTPEGVSPLPWLMVAGVVIIVLLVIIAGLVFLLLN